jgi:hypothetical protein
VVYVFVGRTIFPASLPSVDRMTPESKAWLITYAMHVFEKLGSVVLLADESELDSIRQMLDQDQGAASIQLVDRSFTWEDDFFVEISSDFITINGETRLALPPPGSRGKQVRVVGLWRARGGLAGQDAKFDASIGALIPHLHVSELAVDKVHEVLGQRDRNVVSSWQGHLLASLPEDKNLADFLGSLPLQISHALTDKRLMPERGSVGDVACGTCHTAAAAQWRQSRHPTALQTLRTVGKQSDPRCTGCHTEVPRTGVLERAWYADGIGCLTCHTNQRKVNLDACSPCHTEATDPHQRYKEGFHHICGTRKSSAPMVTEGGGECMLRD